MYIDKYLKFPTKGFADAVLYTLHPKVVDDEGNIIHQEYYTPNYANIDVIGVIYHVDEDNTPMDGWHVNIRAIEGVENIEILKEFIDSCAL